MLKAFFKRNAWRYIIGSVLLLLCVYVQTLSPQVLGKAIDALGAETVRKDAVMRCVWALLILAALTFALRFAWRYFIIGASRLLEKDLRRLLCEKFQTLPASFYNRHAAGDLMAYAVNDVGAVRMTFGPAIAQTLTGIVTAALSLRSMTEVVHPGLTFAALAPLPFAIASTLLLGRLVRSRFRAVQAQFAKLSGHVNEAIGGMRVIKTFAQEKAQAQSYAQESRDMRMLNWKLAKVSAAMSPITQALFGVSFLISIIYGGRLVQQNTITLGNFATFNSYLLMVMSPIVMLGRIANIFQRGRAALNRLGEIFDEPGIPESEMQEDESADPSRLEARNLTFRYEEASSDALSNISFTLEKGKTLGVVGPTGCGKSTLLRLIMKEYQTPEGMLFAGGRDINDIPAFAIRKKCGYVPQEGFLFSGTLSENISFYEPGATEEMVKKAAEEAGLGEDLGNLSHGLETLVGERGAQVSGGQRQRTALARALIRRPSLLLLDDTLSAVDNHTRRKMLESLRNVHGQSTMVIVSHALAAVAHADEILYLENGQVKERGSHEQLLALGGAYAALWEKQQQEEEKAS